MSILAAVLCQVDIDLHLPADVAVEIYVGRVGLLAFGTFVETVPPHEG